jgi:hypothetical protein
LSAIRQNHAVSAPVSWLQIEPGWRIVGSEGATLGSVLSVVGDQTLDIFDGLAIKLDEGSTPRYVPAELVIAIEPGEVKLRLTPADARNLEAFRDPPPVTVWRPPAPSLTSRLGNWLRGRR